VPADADALSFAPGIDVVTDGIHNAGHLVSWNPGIVDAGEGPVFHKRVAVADAARLDANAYLVGSGFGNGDVDNFEGAACFGYLNGLHRGHKRSLTVD
jgi:hypothetical protein